MNRAIIFLLVLLSIHIYFIDNAIGAAEQAPTNNNKIKVSVPKPWYPAKDSPVIEGGLRKMQMKNTNKILSLRMLQTQKHLSLNTRQNACTLCVLVLK